jgi:hypothetical protein
VLSVYRPMLCKFGLGSRLSEVWVIGNSARLNC